MSSIFHGGNTYIFYNTDATNNIPTSVTYKNIDELGAFPQVKINSSTTSIETYNDEWVQVLSGNMSIDSVSIVVHYIATNESHHFLDNAFSNSTNFQIKVSLYESQDSLDQHYVILNGYISGFSDSGDQNEVYNRTYTFVAEDLITRGTAQDPPQLKQGDFGVGADGETYPQYESETPTGNSFIKVPALRTDNPINGDLGGFAFVDNGGDKTAQLAMPSEGDLGIYIKNTDNDWLSVPLKSTNDALYVPLTRTINGKVLSSNITLSPSDVSALPIVGGTLTGALTVPALTVTGTTTLTGTTTAGVVNAGATNATSLTVSGNTTHTGTTTLTGTTTAGTVNAAELTVSGNTAHTGTTTLTGVTTAGTLNATTLNVSGDTVHTGTTALTGITTAGTINATALTLTNALPITQGGTGSSTAADALTNLGAAKSGANSDITSLTGLTTPLSLTQGGTGATTADAARTNLIAAKSGTNSDITTLTALSGPLTLGGDAQQDAQAVTLRQLTAATAGGGSNGATLNGVMNNFLGAVEWYNGTRAALPSGHLAADGQLLNRADYPDLWNAINSGVFLSNTDSAWQSTPTSRGMYSTGDGSTTFRMPDLNGVWVHPTDSTLNSIPALFLRGDGTVANTGTGAGVIRWNAAPNITGGNPTPAGQDFAWRGNTGVVDGSTNGAVAINGIGKYAQGTGSLDATWFNWNFDASRSSVAYGRDTTTEIRPNSVKGIWLIRVNGLFSASNTNFNVINGITAAPATGAVVYGGDVISNLQLNGANYAVARIRSKIVGGASPVVAFGLANSTGSTVVNTEWTLPAVGGELLLNDLTTTSWITPTMQNSWTINQPTVVRTGYRKVLGMLQLSINLQAGTVTDGTTMFTLPVGYRPTMIFSIPGMYAGGRIDINPNGTVTTQGNGSIGTGSLRVYCMIPLE